MKNQILAYERAKWSNIRNKALDNDTHLKHREKKYLESSKVDFPAPFA